MRFLDDEFMIKALDSFVIERDYSKYIHEIDSYIEGLDMNENVRTYIEYVLERSIYNAEVYDSKINNPAPYIRGHLSLQMTCMHYAIRQNCMVEDAKQVISIIKEIDERLYKFVADESNLVLYRDNIVPFNKKEPEDD